MELRPCGSRRGGSAGRAPARLRDETHNLESCGPRSRVRTPLPAPRLNSRPDDGEILTFGLWMERQGYRHATCYSAVKALRRLSRRVDLLDTEAVKTFLAT